MRHRHRPRTLFRQVYFHGVLLLFLVAVALAALGIFLGRSAPWRAHPSRLGHHMAGLLAAVPEDALQSQIERLADDLEVDIAVYADDGRRLASAGRRALPPLPAPVRGDRHSHLSAWAPAGPGRYVRVALRISEGELLLRALGALSLIVLVLALASAPLARTIARPIEHLSRVARRLGEGDLAARARLDRADEIGALARTFDEMAERLGRLLEGQRELLANVSHELRTPLARIRVTLGLAAEAEPEQARRYVSEVEVDLVELERLVSDVLTASRLDSGGGLTLRREPVDLRTLVEAALARFARLHPGRQVEASLDAAASLDAEPDLLGRVFDNLLDNAARYSEPATTIQVGLAAAEGGVAVSVRDHGIGIAPAEKERVFTPFYRTDRSRARNTAGSRAPQRAG